MSKFVLNNGTEIEIESASSLSDIKTISGTKYDMVSAWELLTEENLKHVRVRNDDDIVVGNYENLVLDSETSIVQENGTILTSFHLRKKTEVELLRKEVEALKEGQEVQDGAIADLGEIISDLSGEM